MMTRFPVECNSDLGNRVTPYRGAIAYPVYTAFGGVCAAPQQCLVAATGLQNDEVSRLIIVNYRDKKRASLQVAIVWSLSRIKELRVHAYRIIVSYNVRYSIHTEYF